MAHLLRLSYRLRAHRLGGWALDRWWITLTLGAAGLILVRWLFQGRPAIPIRSLAALTGLLAAALGMLVLTGWASRHGYVSFAREQIDEPEPLPLNPADKVRVWATGRFSVEERSQYLVHLLAYWRTFASREHAVMAIRHQTRFLGLSHTPVEEVGMWYIFFRPEMILEMLPGQLTLGKKPEPALRVTYQGELPAGEQRRRTQVGQEIVYMAFETQSDRRRVWSDLLADRI